MDWRAAVGKWLAQPRVVHRLPGRLRLHFPFLTKVGDPDASLVKLGERLLSIPEEIHQVEVNVTTGNVLIEYDAEAATEEDIMGFLDSAVDACLQHRSELAAMGAEGALEYADQLKALVRRAVRPGPTLDTDLEIPDELMA